MRLGVLMMALALLAAELAADPRTAKARGSAGGSSSVEKSVWFGPGFSYANDANLGLGARALWSVADHSRLGLITSFDYFFPPGSETGVVAVSAKHWEVNGNLAYHFGRRWKPYVGPGLNVARRSAQLSYLGQPSGSTSDTALGLNLLGGVRRTGSSRGGRQYFAEARYEVKGGEQFLVSAGVLF